ncbi:SDR family oxidoreductase [Candidatus Nomurabacteria bacterium]|nr:SDR family oxidoreductase [Candidatus Nomurabacteria bacterium]
MKIKKTAVVVGATGNIGTALVQALSEDGYFVDPTWLGADRPDVRNSSSYDHLPPKIDLAVYLAGITHNDVADELDEEKWDEVLDINLKGAFLFAKAAFPSMKEAGQATFVAMSSINATHPYPRRVAYSASKAGIEGLIRQLAIEWGKYNIASHAIRLGHLSGVMKSSVMNMAVLDAVKAKIPSGRLIPPKAVADYIVWLGKGNAQYVSGGVIDFDPAYMINRNPLI